MLLTSREKVVLGKGGAADVKRMMFWKSEASRRALW